MQAGQRWQRLHANGWFTEMKYAGDGRFDYSIHDSAGRWSSGGYNVVGPVERVQALVDSKVPPHECACAGWGALGAKGEQSS